MLAPRMSLWPWLVVLLQPPETGEIAPGVALEWVAPPSCPDMAEVEQRIAARVQPGSAQGASARLRVTASDPGFVLTLDLSIARGMPMQRVVEGPRCDELVDAASLMIAVAVDPVFVVDLSDVVAIVAAHDATTVPTPRRRPTVVEAPPAARAPTKRDVVPLRIGLRASTGAWIGAMPRPAATIAVDVALPAMRLGWAELGAIAIPRQRTRVSDSVGATLWLASAVLRGCIAPPLRADTQSIARVRPMACVGLATGAIGGRGRGTDVATGAAQALWISAAAGGGLDVTIVRRLGVFARFDGHLHARRPGFHIDGGGRVHRVGLGSMTALVGLQAVLP